MSEEKVQSKYIEQDPPLADSPNLEKRQNDYLAYLKEKLNFILATYGKRLTSADGHVNELIRTAAEFAVVLSHKVGDDEVISSINQSAEQIKIQANKINLVGTTIVDGSLVATYQRIYEYTDYSQADLTKIQNFITGDITFTDEDWDKYSVNGDGCMHVSDLIKIRNLILYQRNGIKNVVITISPPDSGYAITVDNETIWPTDSGTGTSVSTWRTYYDGETACVPRVEATTINPDYVGKYAGETLPRFFGNFYPKQYINSTFEYGIEDFVRDYGVTNDGWTFRRWYSGVYECWKQFTPSIALSSSWGSGSSIWHYGTFGQQDYPVTFDSAPYEYATIVGGYGWAVLCSGDHNPSTTQTAEYHLVRPDSTSAKTYYINIYARGTVST